MRPHPGKWQFTLLFGLLWCESAVPATRTVQFAGLVEMSPTQDSTINASVSVSCRVAVVNTGSTDQDLVNVDFTSFDSEKGILAFPVGPDSSDRFDLATPGGAGCGTGTPLSGGVPIALPPGGVCIFYLGMQTMASQSRLGLCAGRLTVRDTAPGSPGSVVATGVIGHHQESLLLGGAMSGALYMNGLHYWGSTSLETNFTGFAYNQSFNMNIYCDQACQVSAGLSANFCSAQCGYSGTSDGGRPRASLFQVYPATADGFMNSTTPSFVITAPNTHFSGGLVMEMLMGPMTSVCTANKQAWARGAQDFTHPGGLDPLWIDPPNGPPERLFCQHRHAMDDFFFGLSTSSPIVINGGNPF